MTFLFGQIQTYAQEDSSGGDDLPSACMILGSIVLPDGQTIEEFNKKNPGKCDSSCQSQLQESKKIKDRLNLVKPADLVGGKKIDGDVMALRRKIDGPANLRDSPSGKIVGTFPDKFVVLIQGQKDDWFLISGYWERSCETGWTHKKNLLPYP